MAEYDIKLNRDALVGLLTENDALAGLVESVVNQILEAQMTEHLGAARYEHSEARCGYRNGSRMRTLYTRVGPLNLRVPQTRDGSFSTELFKRYQRSEQAFVLGIMEMYLNGVSCRKVTRITEELCGSSFSKSTVSQLCTQLDARLHAWRTRPLHDKRYPFLIVDAFVVKVRRDSAVRSTGVLIVYGVNEEGQREPLDLLLADSENEVSWDTLFKSLKARGLNDVELVVSDDHTGLVNAVHKQFQGVRWQRCQTHFMRNILGHCPRHLKKTIASDLKLVFQAENQETALKLASDLIEKYEKNAKAAMECLERGLDDGLAVLALPVRYRRRLRTTNLAERMNEEIRRRERVIRIFPNEQAAERLIGAILVELYEEWQTNMRYLDMNEFWEWRKEQDLIKAQSNIMTMNN